MTHGSWRAPVLAQSDSYSRYASRRASCARERMPSSARSPSVALPTFARVDNGSESRLRGMGAV